MDWEWHMYELGPIDHNWEYLPKVADVAKTLGGSEAQMMALHGETGEAGISLNNFLSAWESAKTAASCHGWEGDFRGAPVVMWLPVWDTYEFSFGFVLKQDNNGTTLVVSPVPLPHLAEQARR